MPGIFPRVDYAVLRKTWPGWTIAERTIENHELVFVLAGRGIVEINSRRCEVGTGDVMYFTPGLRHALWVEGEPCMEFFGIHFTPRAGDPERLPMEPMEHLNSLLPITDWLYDVVRAYTDKPAHYEWTQELALSHVLRALISGDAGRAESYRVRRALDYIHQNPCRRTTLDELCGLSGLKKSQFSAEFKNMTGKSPIEYCLLLRLEHARDLLITSEVTISEISRRCGFADPLYFSRQFASRYGLPPKTYRERLYIGAGKG